MHPHKEVSAGPGKPDEPSRIRHAASSSRLRGKKPLAKAKAPYAQTVAGYSADSPVRQINVPVMSRTPVEASLDVGSNPSFQLAKLDRVRQMLAESRTLPEVKKIKGIAEAAKVYAKVGPSRSGDPKLRR
jgi:hypothetical protein